MLASVALLAAAPVAALDLPANARLAAETREPLGIADLPTGPWRDGTVPTLRASGALTIEAWQIPSPGLTPAQLLEPLRDQLLAQGFTPVFECADVGCGGFSFRFAVPSLDAPAMHVDLGDYRYLLVRREGDASDDAGSDRATADNFVALLVSRTAERGFVQVLEVSPRAAAPASAPVARQPEAASPPTPVPAASGAAAAGGLPDQLRRDGHVVLADLDFETGSARLAARPYESLAALAEVLRAEPGLRLVLVGHTDVSGPLEANMALSLKRAEAVRERLIAAHGIAPDRLSARGIGPLAPLTSSATPEGRAVNRRVEAVVAGES